MPDSFFNRKFIKIIPLDKLQEAAAIVILEFIKLPDFFKELTKSSKQHDPDYQQ